jgi:hypothetical protein
MWSSSKHRHFRVACRSYWSDDGFRELQDKLGDNPELGDVMPGTGGFRKVRWADARRGKGRRGGLRIIYYHCKPDNQIWLMTLYDKNEAADLTAKEKKALKAWIANELETRAVRAERKRPKGRVQ